MLSGRAKDPLFVLTRRSDKDPSISRREEGMGGGGGGICRQKLYNKYLPSKRTYAWIIDIKTLKIGKHIQRLCKISGNEFWFLFINFILQKQLKWCDI